jgi:hypothetical protein
MDMDDIDLSAFKNLSDYLATLIKSGVQQSTEDVPFDCSHCISTDFAVFGDLGHGPLRGRHVRLSCTPPEVIHPLTDEIIEMPAIGEIVGDLYGRVIVALETEDAVYFFGWLTGDDYQLIDIYSETGSWLH